MHVDGQYIRQCQWDCQEVVKAETELTTIMHQRTRTQQKSISSPPTIHPSTAYICSLHLIKQSFFFLSQETSGVRSLDLRSSDASANLKTSLCVRVLRGTHYLVGQTNQLNLVDLFIDLPFTPIWLGANYIVVSPATPAVHTKKIRGSGIQVGIKTINC